MSLPLDTSPTHIRRVVARDLAAADVAAWNALQEANPLLASPFFRPEFTIAIASIREDVWVAVIERGRGETIGFFAYQKDSMGIGRPVGGGLSDYQGIIAKSHFDLDTAQLLRGHGCHRRGQVLYVRPRG